MATEELFMMDKKPNIMKGILKIIKNMGVVLKSIMMANLKRAHGKMIFLFNPVVSEYYIIFLGLIIYHYL